MKVLILCGNFEYLYIKVVNNFFKTDSLSSSQFFPLWPKMKKNSQFNLSLRIFIFVFTLKRYIFCILFKFLKIKVDQFYFLCFPQTFEMLICPKYKSCEKLVGNKQTEVGQLQFFQIQKIKTKCKKSMLDIRIKIK